MKAEHINPFLESAIYVLGEYGFAKPQLSPPSLASMDPFISQGVAIIVGLTGTLEGRVLFDLSRRFAVKIASQMSGEEMLGFDGLTRSAIAELGNQISGYATTTYRNGGIMVTITPPTFLTGDSIEISSGKNMTAIAVSLRFAEGEMIVNLAVREGQS